jgi:coproporphyrinogen III oxidase-like Fe-S oxidoreductase
MGREQLRVAMAVGLIAATTSFAPRTQIRRPLASLRAAASAASSAYIHIPFCKQRCYYCDFPISVVGDPGRPSARGAIEQYLDALAIELDRGGGGALASERPRGACEIGTQLKTVYLGGGTPSLLEPQQVDRILRALDQRFGIAPDAEISMEMDPGTFDFAKVSLAQTPVCLLPFCRSTSALPPRPAPGPVLIRLLTLYCTHNELCTDQRTHACAHAMCVWGVYKPL